MPRAPLTAPPPGHPHRSEGVRVALWGDARAAGGIDGDGLLWVEYLDEQRVGFSHSISYRHLCCRYFAKISPL